MNSDLHDFACPVCGRVREISARAFREIGQGARTGECRFGDGCRARLSNRERLRRWWLNLCGIDDITIRRAGGAVPFVLEFGMPELPQIHHVPVVRVLKRRPAHGVERPRSKLPGFCFEEADGDPELALSLAIEIIARGLPVHSFLARELPITLVAA